MQKTAAVALLSLAGCFALHEAASQTREIPRPTSERPPFEAAANALGMERGVRRELTAVNTIFFVAKGTLDGDDGERKVERAVIGMSYFIPAIRSDIAWRAGGKPQREIEVANGKLAWDETEPGSGATPTGELASQRLQQVWLTPHGAIRAMVDARARNPQAVTISQAGGRDTFSMPFEGGPLEVTVDVKHRPQLVRWTIGGKVHEAEFFNYKDWELLDVFFPQRIVQRVDGRVVADLTITDFRSNPYVVFPVPKSLRPT